MKSHGTPSLRAGRVVFITLALYGLLLIFYLSAYNWDPSVFIVAGEHFTTPDADIYIHPRDGYDGQFYYRLALDPLTREWAAYGIRLDNPPYRQQRILYPVLAWLLSRIKCGTVPWAMLLINYAALIAIGGLGAAHAIRAGHAPEWGLLFALWPGFLVSLTRDLTEPLAAALLLAALLVRRPWLSALSLSLAVLARETMLLAALALPLPFALLPIIVYATWQTFLWSQWGQWPALAGWGTLAWPPHLLIQGPWIAALLIAAFAILVLLSFHRSSWPGLKVAWLTYLALALLLSGQVWIEPYAYLRAMTEFYLLGMLLLIHTSTSARCQLSGTNQSDHSIPHMAHR